MRLPSATGIGLGSTVVLGELDCERHAIHEPHDLPHRFAAQGDEELGDVPWFRQCGLFPKELGQASPFATIARPDLQVIVRQQSACLQRVRTGCR